MTPDELLESVTTAIHYAAGGALNVHDSRHLARSAIAIVVARCAGIAMAKSDEFTRAAAVWENATEGSIEMERFDRCHARARTSYELASAIRSLCPPLEGSDSSTTSQEPTSGTNNGNAGSAVAVLPANTGGKA
jgi:hypothetical protein